MVRSEGAVSDCQEAFVVSSRLKLFATNSQKIYGDLFKLEQSCKRDVAIRTRMNTNNQLNQSLFDNILNEFERKLEKDFSKMLTQGSIAELKQDMVASWLADCSMEFRSTQNG